MILTRLKNIKFKLNLISLRESKIFIKVGFIAVFIDFMVYSLFLFLGLNPSPSKFLSFISGALFSYNANKNWTFKFNANKYTPFAFLISYALTLYINIIVNKLCLSLSNNRYNSVVIISFVLATIASASINFLCLKFFVFNKNKS